MSRGWGIWEPAGNLILVFLKDKEMRWGLTRLVEKPNASNMKKREKSVREAATWSMLREGGLWRMVEGPQDRKQWYMLPGLGRNYVLGSWEEKDGQKKGLGSMDPR